MKKNVMVCAWALAIGSSAFCMEGYEQEKDRRESAELLRSIEQDSSKTNETFKAEEARNRLAELTKKDKKRIDDDKLRQDACLDLHSAQAALKKFTDALGAKIHDSLPPQIKMVADKAAEHPRATGAVAFAAAEGCGWWCCPGVTYAVNLFLAGYAARIAQTEITKKQKEL